MSANFATFLSSNFVMYSIFAKMKSSVTNVTLFIITDSSKILYADDVITFCLYLMSKMRRNLIKIRSCAIFSWLRVSSYFKVDKRLRFRLVSKEIRNVFIG